MSGMNVVVGTVEVILGDVDVRVRIPGLHGLKTDANHIKTEFLPIAKPNIPLVLHGDRWNADLKVGDKLYLLNAGEFYLYIGKVYIDGGGCDGFFKYAKDCIHDERTGFEPAKKFGGFNIIVDEDANKVEIISASKNGDNISKFAGIVLDGETGNIQLIANNGSNRSIIELGGDKGELELRTVSNGEKTCLINLSNKQVDCTCCPIISPHPVTGHLLIRTTGMVDFKAHCLEEETKEHIGGDSTEWDGKIV